MPENITELWQEILGHKIRIDIWEPDQPAIATLIFVHGAGGNGRLCAPFIQGAEKQGLRVVAPDLPGYGLTSPRKDWDWSYEDWLKVIAELANQQTGPVFLLGASMGGLTSVYAAEWAENLSGIVVTTLLDLSDAKIMARSARWPIFGWLFVGSMKTIPWLLDPIRLPLSFLAQMKSMNANRKLKKYFSKDKLLGRNWMPLRFWRSVFNYRKTDIRLKCPLLLVHPGEDEWTPVELSLQKLKSIDAQKEFKLLSNGGHLPLENPALKELRGHIYDFVRRALAPEG